MKPKPVIPRTLAERDVDEAVIHYLDEGAAAAALHFVDALERAYAHIGRRPAAGSSRYAVELDIPGLFWPLARFPYLVFYFDRPDHVDVWRVLHGRRDIPTWLREPDDRPRAKGVRSSPGESANNELDTEEQEILESFEAGDWRSAKLSAEDRRRFESYRVLDDRQ